MTSRATTPMGRSLLMATSSTPAPSATAIDAAASRLSSGRPLVISPPSRRSMSGSSTVRRTICSGNRGAPPHGAHLAGAANEVGQYKQPNPGPLVVRRHCAQILQHQPEFGCAVIGAGARPAQVVQVEQRIRLGSLLEQVGDLLGDRALARPVNPGEQDALSPACVHQPRLGWRGWILIVPTAADLDVRLSG